MAPGQLFHVGLATGPPGDGQLVEEGGQQAVIGRLAGRSLASHGTRGRSGPGHGAALPPRPIVEGASARIARSRRSARQMPHPGRGVAEPQHPGGLSVGELLEMPEQDDLAIVVVQQAEGLAEPAFQLEPEGQRRRA